MMKPDRSLKDMAVEIDARNAGGDQVGVGLGVQRFFDSGTSDGTL